MEAWLTSTTTTSREPTLIHPVPFLVPAFSRVVLSARLQTRGSQKPNSADHQYSLGKRTTLHPSPPPLSSLHELPRNLQPNKCVSSQTPWWLLWILACAGGSSDIPELEDGRAHEARIVYDPIFDDDLLHP
jgi:hypothetical protein